jgi:hypothetical protein
MDAHPSLDELTEFDRGQLQTSERAAIERHIAACAACCERLEAVADDSLIALLRASGERKPSADLEDTRDLLPNVENSQPAHPATPVPAELTAHPRYRVLDLLGTGGMGAVYKAEHRLMERTVALKIIHQHLVERADAVERFRQEVKAAARLSHPNIVSAFDAEQAGDLHFLVMEYVEGTSLDRMVRTRGPLSVPLACHIARQVALGLQHAHERHMVHRDIKPANILLTPAGQVKVLDFGLARFLRENEGGSLTAPGTVLGTPDYLAPEQAFDARKADIRADIYSLGCTLYFLLAGRPPFPEGSALQKLMAHQQRRPSPLDELRQDVPSELAQILERLMAKDPSERYQTPAEVVGALAPFAGGQTNSPLPAGAGKSAGEDDRTILEPTNRPARARTPVGRWRRLDRRLPIVVVIALIVLLAGSFSLYWWFRGAAGRRSTQLEAKRLFAEGEIRRVGEGECYVHARAHLRRLPACSRRRFGARSRRFRMGSGEGRAGGHHAGPPRASSGLRLLPRRPARPVRWYGRNHSLVGSQPMEIDPDIR